MLRAFWDGWHTALLPAAFPWASLASQPTLPITRPCLNPAIPLFFPISRAYYPAATKHLLFRCYTSLLTCSLLPSTWFCLLSRWSVLPGRARQAPVYLPSSWEDGSWRRHAQACYPGWLGRTPLTPLACDTIQAGRGTGSGVRDVYGARQRRANAAGGDNARGHRATPRTRVTAPRCHALLPATRRACVGHSPHGGDNNGVSFNNKTRVSTGATQADSLDNG